MNHKRRMCVYSFGKGLNWGGFLVWKALNASTVSFSERVRTWKDGSREETHRRLQHDLVPCCGVLQILVDAIVSKCW